MMISDHESYPPPRRRFHAGNAPHILYDRRDLQVTVHRTVECDVELPLPLSCELEKHPLPPLGGARCAAIVLKDAGRASASSESSAAGSSASSEGSGSGAVSPVLED